MLALLPVAQIDQELDAAPARAPEPAVAPQEATKATAVEDVPQHSSAAVLRRQAMLGLQQGSGNVWVARHVAQLMRQGDPAREAFLRQGPMPSAAGLDMTSSTGIGGFNAKYEPSRQALKVTLRVGINAVDGLTIDPNTGVVTPANASFATDAAQSDGDTERGRPRQGGQRQLALDGCRRLPGALRADGRARMG